ncbi:7408_t:CDS:1, partial [Scutellospora calospora]
IVMFAGKFIVKNLEQYISVSYACVIASSDPDQEFQANEIPLSIPHCMLSVLVNHEPKECGESTYFNASCYQYNSSTNSRNVHMKLRIFFPTNAPRYSYLRANNSIKIGKTFIVSGFVRRITADFTIIELTDLDFVTTNINTIQNVQGSTSSRTPKRPRVIASRSSKQSTSSTPVVNEPIPLPTSITPINTNLETVQVQKGKKKLSDLALNCLELIVTDNAQDENIYVEDASEENDDLELLYEQELLCEQELLSSQDVEGQKKKRNKRTSKKVKK